MSAWVTELGGPSEALPRWMARHTIPILFTSLFSARFFYNGLDSRPRRRRKQLKKTKMKNEKKQIK
jgi:hypothetical protein